MAYTYNQRITASLKQMFQEALSRHNRILVIRFDLRYPQDYFEESPHHISSVMTKIKVKYQRKNADPLLFWVREKNNSVHFHYHCLLILDGDNFFYYIPILKSIEKLWKCTLHTEQGGLVDFCNKDYSGLTVKNGIMLNKNSSSFSSDFNALYDRCLYLAKEYTKNMNSGFRNFGRTSF